MASRWRQQEVKRAVTWRQSLLFNSILLLLPIMAARMVIGAYTSDLANDPMGLEARAQTRIEIDRTFRRLYDQGPEHRTIWAARIETSLEARNFSAARGYLLAAPLMLNRQDAAAVNAAAQAEEFGNVDQRLARAALLFLPDATRASYERVITPPELADMQTDAVADSEAVESNLSAPAGQPENMPDGAPIAQPAPVFQPEQDPFNASEAFFLLGDPGDLTRRTQRWLANENVNSLELRLRALGLIMYDKDTDSARDFARAASILRGALRARRLSERFSTYLSGRVEDVLPELQLRQALQPVFEQVTTTDQRKVDVLKAYDAVVDPVALTRLSRDMRIIAELAALTSSSGAIGLVELTETPEEMRRALLVTQAGGDRAVALINDVGPDLLRLAQIGVQWTRLLVLQVMLLVALGMSLIWITLSTLSEAETLKRRRI